MPWKKLGLVYGPNGFAPWATNSAMTPTPLVMDDGRLRVYAGFRDDGGVSRIGWVDLDPDRPTDVIAVSKAPVLDIGKPGCFDDNGVILGDIVRLDERLRMYFVGFQLVAKAKFLAFTGVAESKDGGESFIRLSDAPVLDRSDEGLFFRAIHSAMRIDGQWRVWYGAGGGWSCINGKPYPSYHVRTLCSHDGLTFADQGDACVEPCGREYRLGRPRVWGADGAYHMFFTYGTLEGEYLPGYAFSTDGIHWTRDDRQAELEPSAEGWDSRWLCYAAPVRVGDRTYVVYNGNDFGRAGFGCAIHVS